MQAGQRASYKVRTLERTHTCHGWPLPLFTTPTPLPRRQLAAQRRKPGHRGPPPCRGDTALPAPHLLFSMSLRCPSLCRSSRRPQAAPHRRGAARLPDGVHPALHLMGQIGQEEDPACPAWVCPDPMGSGPKTGRDLQMVKFQRK